MPLPESIVEEIEWMTKILAAFLVLLIGSIANYIRTLDRETFINDLQLLKLISQGKRIMFLEDGKWIVVKGHKRVCKDCIHSHCPDCQHMDPTDRPTSLKE